MEKSTSVTVINDKREDGEILTEALSSVVSRLNDAYARLSKLEKQMNLHPRSVQDYPEEVKHYDQTLPTLLAIVRSSQQLKHKALQQQVILLLSLWSVTRQLIFISATHKRPTDYSSFISPVTDLVKDIATISESEGSRGEEDSVVGILNAISLAAQAFKWVVGVSPITIVVDTRSAFLKVKTTDSILELVERLLNELAIYLDNYHKCGIDWKGTRETPHLVWELASFHRGLGTIPKSKSPGKEQDLVCENATKTQNYDCAKGQNCIILNSNQATVSISGESPSLLVSGCTYSTLTIEKVARIDIINCKEVKVVCPLATEICVERSAGVHLLAGASTEITTLWVSDLKVEAKTDDSELVEVSIPTGVKIKVAKGGKLTTSVC